MRFTLARGAAQGHDIRLGPQDVENNRNFATKLWNAARFAEMNGCATAAGFDPRAAKETLNRWIAHETAKAADEVTAAIETYKFNEAAAAAYRFVWNIYCDWYLELVKPVLLGPDSAAKRETQNMVAWARDEILKLLHPFMPFVTEELWGVTGQRAQQLLALDRVAVARRSRRRQGRGGNRLGDRSGQRHPFGARRNEHDRANPARAGRRIARDNCARDALGRVHQASRPRLRDFLCDQCATGVGAILVRGEVAALPLKGVIDLAAERARLAKEMQKAEADIARVDAKLGNANFVARAPEDVVEEEKEKREEAVARKAKLAEAVERLKNAG